MINVENQEDLLSNFDKQYSKAIRTKSNIN